MDNATAPPPAEDRRLDAARRLLAHVGTLLDADLSVRLWNGEVVPLRPDARADVLVAINSPGALTRLARAPRLDTLVTLFAAGALDIEGGTLLDLAERRGAMRTKRLFRRLDKRLLLSLAPAFLLGSRDLSPGARSQAYEGRIETREARGRDNKALVGFHYDLSNEFYALFLDPEMVYSCAYFPRWDATLGEAQVAKLDLVCRKLRLAGGERFLDIGCGWGGLVCHAARHYGVRAHGVTLSEEQLAFAQAKVARLGLDGRVTLELRDYRTIDPDAPEQAGTVSGRFDKIASVGMFEHVGLDNHLDYFRHLRRLLRPGGVLLNHSIAERAKGTERRFRAKSPEFRALTRYVFPGGELDWIGRSLANMERASFAVQDVEALRPHYARTCRLWTQALYANREAAAGLVGGAKVRLWLLYLAGCALAFERGSALIFQTLATRERKGAPTLPPTRDDIYAP